MDRAPRETHCLRNACNAMSAFPVRRTSAFLFARSGLFSRQTLAPSRLLQPYLLPPSAWLPAWRDQNSQNGGHRGRLIECTVTVTRCYPRDPLYYRDKLPVPRLRFPSSCLTPKAQTSIGSRMGLSIIFNNWDELNVTTRVASKLTCHKTLVACRKASNAVAELHDDP
jgi:hypothetical protein